MIDINVKTTEIPGLFDFSVDVNGTTVNYGLVYEKDLEDILLEAEFQIKNILQKYSA